MRHWASRCHDARLAQLFSCTTVGSHWVCDLSSWPATGTRRTRRRPAEMSFRANGRAGTARPPVRSRR
jgi:hypothetical protein